MKEFWKALLTFPFVKPLLIIGGIIVALGIASFIADFIIYYKTEYYKATKIPFLWLRFDLSKDGKGRYGEFLIYIHLKKYEKDGAKFLFNLNVPKSDDQSTELDVVMIYKRGINVFESKNFSGWIFGDETNKNWCQSLPAGKGKSKKEYFYNPIKQNKGHIENLRAFLKTDVPIRSIIVFSNRCEFKKLNYDRGGNVHVIKRGYIIVSDSLTEKVDELSNACPGDVLDENEITAIYEKLYPFCGVDKNPLATQNMNEGN